MTTDQAPKHNLTPEFRDKLTQKLARKFSDVIANEGVRLGRIISVRSF